MRDAVLIFVFFFLSFFKALIFSLSFLLSNLFFFFLSLSLSLLPIWRGADLITYKQINEMGKDIYIDLTYRVS